MRVVTIVSLGASAVLGLGALFVAKTVLPNVSAARAAAAAEPSRAGVPIVVAARDIKYGQRLEPGFLTVARIPGNLAPQGAFTTVSQVMAQDRGGAPVALTPMVAREPVLPAKLSGPGARPSVAAEIAEGMRAYTIKVTDVSGVGGHALPGDRVDVVLMRDLTPEGQVRNYISYVVLQNVRVLGIDLNADLSSNKPATPNTATLEVSVPDTQKLSVAATLGALSLSLRRTGQADIAATGPMLTRDFLGGPTPVRYVGRGAPARRSAPAVFHSPIIIIEAAGTRRRARPEPAPVAAPPAAPAAVASGSPTPVTGA